MHHHTLIFVGVAFVAGILWGQQQAAAGNTGIAAIIKATSSAPPTNGAELTLSRTGAAWRSPTGCGG